MARVQCVEAEMTQTSGRPVRARGNEKCMAGGTGQMLIIQEMHDFTERTRSWSAFIPAPVRSGFRLSELAYATSDIADQR